MNKGFINLILIILGLVIAFVLFGFFTTPKVNTTTIGLSLDFVNYS